MSQINESESKQNNCTISSMSRLLEDSMHAFPMINVTSSKDEKLFEVIA
jgi:hypothetical protein